MAALSSSVRQQVDRDIGRHYQHRVAETTVIALAANAQTLDQVFPPVRSIAYLLILATDRFTLNHSRAMQRPDLEAAYGSREIVKLWTRQTAMLT